MANRAALVGTVLNAGSSSRMDRYDSSHSRQFAKPLICLKAVILRKRAFWLTENISTMNLSRSKWNTRSRTFFRVLLDALSSYSSPWSLQIPIDGLSVLDHILAPAVISREKKSQRHLLAVHFSNISFPLYFTLSDKS